MSADLSIAPSPSSLLSRSNTTLWVSSVSVAGLLVSFTVNVALVPSSSVCLDISEIRNPAVSLLLLVTETLSGSVVPTFLYSGSVVVATFLSVVKLIK